MINKTEKFPVFLGTPILRLTGCTLIELYLQTLRARGSSPHSFIFLESFSFFPVMANGFHNHLDEIHCME